MVNYIIDNKERRQAHRTRVSAMSIVKKAPLYEPYGDGGQGAAVKY